MKPNYDKDEENRQQKLRVKSIHTWYKNICKQAVDSKVKDENKDKHGL